MIDIFGSKGSAKFICEKCDYITIRKSQFKRHLATDKHQILTNTDAKIPKVPH